MKYSVEHSPKFKACMRNYRKVTIFNITTATTTTAVHENSVLTVTATFSTVVVESEKKNDYKTDLSHRSLNAI